MIITPDELREIMQVKTHDLGHGFLTFSLISFALLVFCISYSVYCVIVKNKDIPVGFTAILGAFSSIGFLLFLVMGIVYSNLPINDNYLSDKYYEEHYEEYMETKDPVLENKLIEYLDDKCKGFYNSDEEIHHYEKECTTNRYIFNCLSTLALIEGSIVILNISAYYLLCIYYKKLYKKCKYLNDRYGHDTFDSINTTTLSIIAEITEPVEIVNNEVTYKKKPNYQNRYHNFSKEGNLE